MKVSPMSSQIRPLAIVALSFCLLITACGGGGGDSAESTPVSAPAPVPADAAVPAPMVPVPVEEVAPEPAPPAASAPAAEAAPAPGPTRVVALDGSDTNPGTAELPLATLQRAIDLTQPGDTVLVRSGVYVVDRAVRISNKQATEALPITIAGEEGTVLRSAGEGIPGVWRGIIEIDTSAHIVVRSLAVENSSFFGFRVQDSQNITLEGNRSTISLGSGIYARNSTAVRVLQNDVSRFCDRNQFGAAPDVACQEGISLSNVDGFSVRENRVHDAPQAADVGPGGGEGIDIKNGSRNGVVAFNLVWNLVQLGIYVDGWTAGVSNIEVTGNRVWNTYMGIVVSSEMGGTVSDIAIHDNIVHGVGVDGILVSSFKAGALGDGPRTRIAIYNNTVVNAGIKEAKPPFYARWVTGPFPDWGTGINIGTSNASGLAVFDNLVYGSKTAALAMPAAVRVAARVETNLVWPAASANAVNPYDGLRPVLAPPGFVAAADGDWHLAPGSAAIAAGSGGGVLSVDADNLLRPAGVFDLGALAFRSR